MARRAAAELYRARWLVVHAERVLCDAAIMVRNGRIAAVLDTATGVRRAARDPLVSVRDLGEGVLAPGFVNAHAHLELSSCAGKLNARAGFVAWIRALIAERAQAAPERHAAPLRVAADGLLESGTTTVGDIQSSALVLTQLAQHPLRLVAYREALDARDPSRTRSALHGALAPPARRARTWRGISPHAPYTVSEELAGGLAHAARRGRWRVAVHWAETSEEREWLEHGRGPFAELLSRTPHANALEELVRAGLVGPRTALIHGNDARPAERALIAASGAALVHCPGTHAFFGRPAFDLAAWRRAGVPLALGTDSLASNTALDLRRELALVCAAQDSLAPAEAFDLATRGGARALALAGSIGELSLGAHADFVLHAARAADPRSVLQELGRGQSSVLGTWIGGRAAFQGPALAGKEADGLDLGSNVAQ